MLLSNYHTMKHKTTLNPFHVTIELLASLMGLGTRLAG